VPYLKLVAGDRVHEVRDAVALLGRDPVAAIVFGPEAVVVSGRHAELRHDAGGWRVHDLQSRNGVFVNGRRVQGEQPLAVGDEIRLGESGPRLRVGAIAEGAEVPATQVELVPVASPPPDATAAATPAAAPLPPEIRAYAITLLAAGSGRRFEARGTRIRIGRGKECEVRPVDPGDAAVSRVHAELLVGPTAALTLQDAGSTNGTLLNGDLLTEPTPVRMGDRIQLGRAGPVLIIEGLGTSPGIPAAPRDALGQHTVMGMIGAALARAKEDQSKGRRTSMFVREISDRLQGDARRRGRFLIGVIVTLVVLLAGAVYGVYHLLSGEVAQTEQAMQGVEDSARADAERLRRELNDARAASAPAAEVERLRAALDSAQATSAELRAALERAQTDIQSQLSAAESRRAQSELQVQRMREQLAAAERRALNPATVDSLRRAVAAAESQTAQMTARLRAVRSADFASVAQETQGAVGLITVSLGADYYDGTGFVISSDGYMLTNWHVVADSAHERPDTVWVTMADEARARLDEEHHHNAGTHAAGRERRGRRGGSPRQRAVARSRPVRPASGSRIRATNWLSASPTPRRIPRPKAPSSGRAYSGTSAAIVSRISAVIASSSGSTKSATDASRPRQGSFVAELII